LPEDDQAEMIAYVTEICKTCGNLRSVCSDPDLALYPQRSMCYSSAARELTVRRLREKHKAEPGTAELHPLDGLSVWMSPEDLTPDDDFV
jgi:hypothetical protein